MISLSGIRRVFRVGGEEVQALRGLDLEIGAGEYVSIMGPSGSGKSTLLNVLGLLDRPTSGIYRLEGRETNSLSEDELASARRNRIGFVFQFFHLVPRLTAAQNVELPLILAEIAPRERQPRVAESLAAMSLTGRAQHRPDQLSGGQRQRVAIARATVLRPAMLLADEPTGNLDRTSSHDIVDLLERLNREGLTLIVVTHDPDLGGRAHRKVKMADGKIVEDRQ